MATATRRITVEWVATIRDDYMTMDPVGNTEHQGGSVWAAQKAGKRLFVARAGRWVEVEAVNLRYHPDPAHDLSRQVDLVEVGPSWPIGDHRGTGVAVIDGCTYRLTMPWSDLGPEHLLVSY
ncbi:MAG: hypothetical protein KGL39_55220 [Patescibacteria group bacterium]|nr:hypothetical protein [Patescibacteria group bacterium]